METDYISRLKADGKISLEIHAGIRLRIKEDAFRPGTVRVMLPVPINASFLHEGQLLDFDPMFRMVSVEDYPQRTAYFNERLTENRDFYIEFAFSNEFTYVEPDLALIDSTPQKGFTKEQLDSYYNNHHCGCESYTGLARDAVSIMDLASEDFISFTEEKLSVLEKLGLVTGDSLSDYQIDASYAGRNGSIAYKLYKYYCELPGTAQKDCIVRDYASEYVALCRMCGVPARWMGGFEPDYSELTAKPHSWALIYLAPYGWIYADPVNGRNSSLTDFYFGNINPSVIPTASRFGGSMYPAKDYDRADSLYNVYGEVELVPDKLGADCSPEEMKGYGLKSDQFDTSIQIIR